MEPATSPPHLRDALLLLRREHFPEALDALDAALAAEPDNADVHAFRSAALLALGRPVDAQAAAELALSLDPDGFAANQKGGELSFRMGLLDAAADQFLAAVRAARPGSADEAAAASFLALVRKRQRSAISHHAVLPGLTGDWRPSRRALANRWRGFLRRPVAG
jgi:tetratricopeptide (TPR) repeat protein